MNVTIRPSTLEDYDGIAATVSRSGLEMVSHQEYLHRWSTNPFTPADRIGQTGWLMQTEAGQIVGWAGNIFAGYEWEGRFLLAAGTHAWAVEDQYRTKSIPLLASFFRQSGVDLLLDTTAIAKAGQIFTGFKGFRLPRPSYDRVLYWICDYGRFVGAALHKKQMPLAGILGGAGGIVMSMADGLRGRNSARRCPPGEPVAKLVPDFDARFDAAWQRLRLRRGRLLAIRSRAALAWHYHDALQAKRLAIVVLEEGDSLAGYAILIRRDAQNIGLRLFVVADLQVLDENPVLVRRLLAGAMEAARAHGVHVLEANGFDSFKHGVLDASNPRIRQSPSWPYFYKAISPPLAQALQSVDAWDPCPYDGDAAF